MPMPWKEITLDEFLYHAFCNPWQLTGEGMFRGVLDMSPDGHEGNYSTTFMHHQDGYTLAVMKRHGAFDGKKPKGWDRLIKALNWGPRLQEKYGYALRFFWVGCQHDKMAEVSHEFARTELGLKPWGMFCHVSYCPDCGYHRTVDSSG